ncbi:Vesicle-associated protein 4-1 [Linum grandiflorum]
MAIADRHKSNGDGKLFGLCPFWQSGNVTNSSSTSSSTQNLNHLGYHSTPGLYGSSSSKPPPSSSVKTVSSVARSLLPARRRLRLDPLNHLYFPHEPGKQVRSAVKLKNTSRSHVAFKFQTTAPKSCYMRPPGGVLAPGESLIATVFKFVEQPEKENEKQASEQKSKDKFKIMSLKVKGGLEYVPELFDEEKEKVSVERILRVVFLDPERPNAALEKLNRQLAEAEADLEARKKPPVETGPKVIGEGLVIDEWVMDRIHIHIKERREKYLARQQVGAVDST